MNIGERVEEYVKHRSFGSVFSHQQLVKRFGGHSSRISQSLAELEKAKEIMPIERGLWQRPKKTRFGIVQASPQTVVSVLEKTREVFIIYAGAAALNEIGASTQMAMKSSYLSTKRIKPIKMGKTVIQFKYSRSLGTVEAMLTGLSATEKKQAAALWVALHYAGEDHARRELKAFSEAFEHLSAKAQTKLQKVFVGKMLWAKDVMEASNERAVSV
jgi:hypothetical protein